jgi:hypothetical protein
MSAKFPLSAVAAVLLLAPAPLLAGGLPRLCIPVDGVTAATAPDCAKRIAAALGAKAENVELRESSKQWYAVFNYNGGEFPLATLDAALKGSKFSVPRDTLRLFGHVALEVEIGDMQTPKLLADLKAVKYLTVDKTKREKGVLIVSAVMPFPKHMGRETAEFGKSPVEMEVFGSDRSDLGRNYDPPAAAGDLPTYGALRAVVEKHSGSLKGIRWQCVGCSVQGGLAVPAAKRE